MRAILQCKDENLIKLKTGSAVGVISVHYSILSHGMFDRMLSPSLK